MHFRHISAKIQLKKPETTFRLGRLSLPWLPGPPGYALDSVNLLLHKHTFSIGIPDVHVLNLFQNNSSK